MFFPEFDHVGMPEILCIAGGAGFVLLVLNYCLNYLPVSLFKQTRLPAKSTLPPVSLIICAKNEEENLLKFLPRILQQKYHEYEVIVVNDCSWDNTEGVIDELAKTYPHLRKANIKEDAYYKHGKKFAMLVGIKAAKYNHLLFTDADCYPASDQWLNEMTSGFSEEKEIVLGYGAYEKQKGLLNKLIRFDAFIIAVQYFSATLKRKSYMGVGRNLAYTKELFFEQKGFSKHYHINSGDDDLFVNQASTSSNVNVCIDKNAITYSQPEQTFKQWNIQKVRHLTTSPLYSASTKLKIGFNYFSQYFFYAGLLAQFFSIKTLLIIPILLFLKIITQVLVLNKAAKNLNEKDLLAGSWFYELVLLFIYPIFHVSKFFYKPNTWTN
jgi:cellulose synthase/poly-beta-1,6-N-acetylglucosamine synthase-like glycosyltransferase